MSSEKAQILSKLRANSAKIKTLELPMQWPDRMKKMIHLDKALGVFHDFTH